jgi:signal transduction histidine kinase
MKTDSIVDKLIIEEIKATKLFLWLFYIIFFAYDAFYYFILPLLTNANEVGLPKYGLGFWFHIIILGFLPVAYYLIKSDKPSKVKYLYFIGFTILDIIHTLMIYVGSDKQFASGNLVELFLILFASIFINRKYFIIVSSIMVFKYILFGVVIHDGRLVLGIVILLVIASISYLFLSRFISYIKTLEKVNEDLRQKEKLALAGQLATSIGHEIRNPLAALKGFTQLQQEKYPDDQGYFKLMESEIERINLIVNDLMYIGKPSNIVIENYNLKELINYVVKMLNPISLTNNVTIDMCLEDVLKVQCDGNQIKQVFLNLIKNAIESMPEGGNIKISSKIIETKELSIIIEDEGNGIDKEKIALLGQPFYTTKQDGSGLGLMVSYNIIEKHNGRMVYNSTVGKGTKVEIYLPIN